MATDSQRPLTFLSLPYEVTSLVYQHLFGPDIVLENRWRPVWAGSFQPHILNVCYKTRSGALRVLSKLLTVHINAYSTLHADVPSYYLEHVAKLSISIHANDADLSRFPKLKCVELCHFKITIREQLASAVDTTNTEEMKLFLKEVIETEIERQDPMKEWWAEEENTWVDGVLAVGADLHLVIQVKGMCLGPLVCLLCLPSYLTCDCALT